MNDINKIILNKKYNHGDYKFEGTVESLLDDNRFVKIFSGFSSATSFQLNWENEGSGFKGRGSVIIDGSGGINKMEKFKDVHCDAEMAIAGATGVSGGSAFLMYSLWNGKHLNIFPKDDVKINNDGSLITVIGTHNKNSLITIAIQGDILKSITRECDPSFSAEIPRREISDDQINAILGRFKIKIPKEEELILREKTKSLNTRGGNKIGKTSTKISVSVKWSNH